jgi:sigma-E factor negative regulatory protein RseC
MSVEKGTVESIEDGFAWVLTRRKESCSDCGHKHHCHMVQGMDRMRVRARNAARAREGDEVELYISSKTKLKGLFVLYMFPVLGLFIGAFSAEPLSRLIGLSQNVGIVLFTLSGFVLALILARFVSERMAASQELIPKISRVVGRSRVPPPPIPTEPAGQECCSSPGTGSV